MIENELKDEFMREFASLDERGKRNILASMKTTQELNKIPGHEDSFYVIIQ